MVTKAPVKNFDNLTNKNNDQEVAKPPLKSALKKPKVVKPSMDNLVEQIRDIQIDSGDKQGLLNIENKENNEDGVKKRKKIRSKTDEKLPNTEETEQEIRKSTRPKKESKKKSPKKSKKAKKTKESPSNGSIITEPDQGNNKTNDQMSSIDNKINDSHQELNKNEEMVNPSNQLVDENQIINQKSAKTIEKTFVIRENTASSSQEDQNVDQMEIQEENTYMNQTKNINQSPNQIETRHLNVTIDCSHLITDDESNDADANLPHLNPAESNQNLKRPILNLTIDKLPAQHKILSSTLNDLNEKEVGPNQNKEDINKEDEVAKPKIGKARIVRPKQTVLVVSKPSDDPKDEVLTTKVVEIGTLLTFNNY